MPDDQHTENEDETSSNIAEDEDVEGEFTSVKARRLVQYLSRIRLPRMTAENQMHLLAVIDTVKVIHRRSHHQSYHFLTSIVRNDLAGPQNEDGWARRVRASIHAQCAHSSIRHQKQVSNAYYENTLFILIVWFCCARLGVTAASLSTANATATVPSSTSAWAVHSDAQETLLTSCLPDIFNPQVWQTDDRKKSAYSIVMLRSNVSSGQTFARWEWDIG